MASVGLPHMLARCRCGELKVQDNFLVKPYWTRYAPYMQEAKKRDLPKENCPMCGGDRKIPIGDYFIFSRLAEGLPA